MQGGYVCRLHGGSAPQVKQAARSRMAAMVDPSLDLIWQTLKPKKGESPAKLETRIRCAWDMLDRNGLKARDEVVVTQQFNVGQFQHLSDEEIEQLITLARKATIPTAVHEGEMIEPLQITDGAPAPSE